LELLPIRGAFPRCGAIPFAKVGVVVVGLMAGKGWL